MPYGKQESLETTGHYTWAKNYLTVAVVNAQPFVLEIRRKGVDAPACKMEVTAGAELRWKTQPNGDQLTLSGPPGWEFPVTSKSTFIPGPEYGGRWFKFGECLY